MKTYLLLLLLLVSCAHKKPQAVQCPEPDDDRVSVNAALNQAQMSYLKGCVDSFRFLRMAPSFEHCVEKAKAHRLDIQSIMDQIPEEVVNEKL